MNGETAEEKPVGRKKASRERTQSGQKGVDMIRVSVEICSGAARFRAAVWAESIERALSLVKAHYPGGEARVVFPIESEAFFVDGAVPSSGVVHLETPEEAAG
jgi:hypothetical protein